MNDGKTLVCITKQDLSIFYSGETTQDNQISDFVEQRYPWNYVQNQAQAMAYQHAFRVALRHGATTQAELYKKQLITLVCKDVAEYSSALITRHTGYVGNLYQHTGNMNVHTAQFYSPPFRRGLQACEWHYMLLNGYPDWIPPHAMVALDVLDQAQVPTQKLWVARLEKQRTPLPDPLLCVQFGPWFVAIAEWV